MECKEYIYKTCSDGTEIALDVYYPTDSTPDVTRPIAIYYHGGGWVIGSKFEFPKSHAEKLLKLDFIAVSVNYRLCPTISVWDGAASDALDAYKWCQTKLSQILKEETGGKVSVDGNTIVTIGASAGGSLAAMPTQLPSPPKAYMDLYATKFLSDPQWSIPSETMKSFGPSTFDPDLVSQVYNEIPPPTSFSLFDPSTFMPDFTNPRTAFFFDAARNGTMTSKTIIDGNTSRIDPVTHITTLSKFPPTIIIHGTADEAVPIKYSQKMLELLHEKGVTQSELIKVEGLGHGFDISPSPVPLSDEDKENVDQAMQKGFEFLKRFCSR